MLKFLERVSTNIDDLTIKVGKFSSWIILALILAQFILLILKNIFGITIGPSFDPNLVALGLLIMAGAAHNLLTNTHLKIDGFIKNTSQRKQAIINIIGGLFFVLPTAALIFGLSWSYFLRELQKHQFLFSSEVFTDPSSVRIMSLYAFISIIIVFTQLTALAGISLACKAGLALSQLKSEKYVKSIEGSKKA